MRYPKEMVDSTLRKLNQENKGRGKAPHDPAVYIKLPFKDQLSANRVRKETKSLVSKIDVNIQPVLTSYECQEGALYFLREA